MITFALPEGGEQIIPETQFVIQFSNPMDPASIQGRVSLGYAGLQTRRPGVRLAPSHLRDHTRHIVIDPGGP